VEKGIKLESTYTYRCVICDLTFLLEELPERYIKSKRTCVRCLVNEKINNESLVVPVCFGRKYDGADENCTRYCTLRHACIIETVDFSSSKWAIERKILVPKTSKKGGRKFRFVPHVLRLLRTAGRPMHLEDIAPIIAYNNGGQAKFKENRIKWNFRVLESLENCADVVKLGENFYIWAGIWNLRDGGKIHSQESKKTEKLISLEEIFKDL